MTRNSNAGTIEVDSKAILVEVLEHMKQQNDHQVSQLQRGEDLIRQLRSTNMRINVLVLAAILLLGLGAVHQSKIDRIVNAQEAASVRSVTLEKAVDQKIAIGTSDIVKKVEELSKTSPKVVAGSNGELSLSVPVTAGLENTTVPSVVVGVPHKPANPPTHMTATKSAQDGRDHVLLPLSEVVR